MVRPVVVLSMTAAIALGQDGRTVSEPVIPTACVTLTARLTTHSAALAEADESQPDTARIQNALDHCRPGKAVVLARDGAHNAFLSGPLDLRYGVTLVVARGVLLLGSRDPRDYDIRPGVCGTITEEGHGCRALVNGSGVADAAVMGDGVIDGRSGAKIRGQDITWWDLAEQARKGGNQNCPRILILSRCNNFTLYRITLRNSPNFHVSYSGGHGFTVWGVKVYSPQRGARNTDGIDPGNSSDVTITRSFIHTGDDNVAIKAGPGAPTRNMTISHNHFYSGHGMSIGSNTDGGANAIRVTDLSIDGADNGIRIKSNSSRGGLVRDVVYEDICIRDTRNPIFMDSNYSYFGKSRDKLPQFRDIVLRNVRIAGSGKITLDGFDQAHRLGVAFDNVTLDDPGSVRVAAQNADVTLGPGPVNFEPAGPGVAVKGKAGEGQKDSCSAKFVPFPPMPE